MATHNYLSDQMNVSMQSTSFSLLLNLGITCLQYFSYIRSSPGFGMLHDFEVTERINVAEYLEGSRISLQCESQHIVFWFFGNQRNNEVKIEEISSTVELYSQFQIYENGQVFVIERAHSRLEGAYTCMMLEGNIYKDFTYRIYVKELPRFVNFDERIFGVKYDSITFNCTAPGALDENLLIIWERHHQIIKPSDKYRITHDNDVYSLTIAELTAEDEGWYYCRYVIYPMKKRKFILYVKTITKINAYYERQIVHEGKNATFYCPTEKYKISRLTRLSKIHGNEIDINYDFFHENGTTTFTINHVTAEDEGFYFCRVASIQVSNYTLLLVIEKSPVLMTENKRIEAYEVSEVKIRCDSTFLSFQQIIWMDQRTQNIIAYGDELSEQYTSKYKLLVDEYSSTLLIKFAEFHNTDVYICMLEERRAHINLTIISVPQVIGCMYYNFVPLGSNTEMECNHKSTLDLNLTWFHNGVKLDLNSRKYSAENSEFRSKLILYNVQHSDSGEYTQCFDVHNNNCSHRYLIPSLNLGVIEQKSEVSYKNKFELRTDGEEIEMVCSVSSLSTVNVLCWIFPDGSVKHCESDYVTDETYQIHSGGNECNLSISNLSPEIHKGNYTCKLYCTEEDNIYIVSYNLRVTVGPRFIYQSMNITAFLGLEYVIKCEVIKPDVREIILIKETINGDKIITTKLMSKGQRYQLNYHIADLKEDDEGNYKCKFFPSTKNNDRLGEMKIFLTAINTPLFETLVTGKLSVGERVALHCNVFERGNSKLNFDIQWVKVESNQSYLISTGEFLFEDPLYYQVSTQKNQSQLIIKHLFNRDFGLYLCKINTVPEISQEIFLNFESLAIIKKEKILGMKGLTIELSCNYSSEDEDNSWFVMKNNYFHCITFLISNSREEHNDAKYKVSRENLFSKLEIFKAASLDTATYRCLKINNSIIDQPVEVVEAPIFNISDINVQLGKTATLTCTVENLFYFKMYWIRNQKKITGRENRYTLIKITSQEELSIIIEIMDVNVKDQGNYTCAITGTSPVLQKTVQLTVFGMLEIN